MTSEQIWDLFRLRGGEKINEKYTFLLYFSMIYPKINFFFLEKSVMKNYELLKLYISYVFVKKSNFVFSFSSTLYFDSLKVFRLCIVDTRRRNILFH